MAFNERLAVVELNAANAVVELLNLNDGIHFFMGTKTFKVVAPVATRVEAANQRRWGGAKQVGETHANGMVAWEAMVAGSSEQQAIEKVEVLLAQLAANPVQPRLYLLWQAAGVSEPTLYEMRGTGHFEPLFDVGALEGAGLFPVQVEIPVAPLALGLPVKVYEKAGLVLPEVLSITGVPGDAPCKAEVSIETGSAAEESFITGQHGPYGIAVDSTYIYWANAESGYIGRAKLNGTSVEPTWLHTEATGVVGLAVDSAHIYWGAGPTNYIGRATIAGASIEKTWLKAESGVEGIAVNATNIFWTLTGGTIGRATIAGGSIEVSWLTTKAPTGIALTATHIYWTSASTNAIGRAPLTEPAEAESRWITGANEPRGIAADATHLYWVNVATGFVGHALLDGEEVSQSWMSVGAHEVPGHIAINAEYVYVAQYSVNKITRGAITAAPVWALIGWTAQPIAGLLAPEPFGLLDSAIATEIQGWLDGTVAGARGGKALHTLIAPSVACYFNVDPAKLAPDSFSGELTVEVWARVLLSAALVSASLTLSAQPQDGGFGAPRYTDEWGSAGRPLALPEGTEKWRMTRLGTLHLLVNPLAPRIWKLWVEGEAAVGGRWGLDYLLLVPSTQRACSPSGKPYGASYPPFIAGLGPTAKTVRSDLSALISEPGKNGHPDHGLGGQLLELPAGESQLLVKLSSLVPDPPASVAASPVSEQLSHECKVSVTVAPRWFLARTS